MEADGSGGEAAATPVPGRGMKRPPPSPATPPSDRDDDDDDSWALSDSGSEEEEEEDEDEDDQGTCRPFTVDEFPRFNSEHFVQTHTLYEFPDICLRGPPPLSIFRVYNDPVSVKEGKHWFTREYRLDNESETSAESFKTADCSNGCCCTPMSLIQFIDLKISGYRHVHPGRAKIFGFFAARDRIDHLRNYVFRHGIDDYEAVSVKRKTGIARLSLTTPARAIGMLTHVLFEFKLWILTECPPEGEPKCETLIEGCTEITNMLRSEPFIETGRLYGEKCGLDVKFAVLTIAVQATVYTEILCAPVCGLNLKLCAKTSGFSDVIRLFRGVAEAGRRLSSVVAVQICSDLVICIEGSSIDNGLSQKLSCVRRECRFSCCYHGTLEEVVKLDEFTTISVKVTWRAFDS